MSSTGEQGNAATAAGGTPRALTVPELVGRKIDKYEIVSVVGRGGMGCVYEAVNTTINKRVALKCIDHHLARSDEAYARFQREALATSAVESPHIVQIFDAGVKDDVPYIVMELLRGQDLGSYITELGRLEVADALLVTSQILKGLHHAHAAGIIHRDLKPDNVFLVERDDEPYFVKLLDFGVSKIARDTEVPLETLTRQGTVVGTPYYMSPEQAQAFPDVDGRTDIYSTGAILYECLTGRPPHSGGSYEQVIVSICMKDAPDVRLHNPVVPEGVAKLIAKALCRDRDKRFEDARAMLDALVDNAPDTLKRMTPSARLRRLSVDPRSDPAKDSGELATPRVVSTPDGRRPSELADTVASDTPLPGAERQAASARMMESAADTLPTPRPKQRRPLAVVVGVVLLASLGVIYLLSRGPGAAPGAQATPTEPTAAAIAEPVPTATEQTQAELPSASPASSSAPATVNAASQAPATKPAPKHIAGPAPKAVKPKPTGKTPSTAEPPPQPKTPKPGLELMPR